MARKPITKRSNLVLEEMTPEQRAQKFSKGAFTASQTGAKKAAQSNYRQRKNLVREILPAGDTTSTFEDYISGKKKR